MFSKVICQIPRLHRTKKHRIFTHIWRFRTVTLVWIHRWLWNDAQSLKQYRRGALWCLKVINQISRSHGTKIDNFDPNWAFPDCNFNLNSMMALKRCTKLDVVQKRCPIVFQGHLSNFKFTRDKKTSNFYPHLAFLDCNSSFNSLMVMKWCTTLEAI